MKRYIIQAILSVRGRDHSSALEGLLVALWGKLRLGDPDRGSGGLWRCPLPSSLLQFFTREHEIANWSWVPGGQKLSVFPPTPLSQVWAGALERVGPDTGRGLTPAQSLEGRGGCEHHILVSPGPPSARTASWGNPAGYRETGGPGQGCKQEQCVSFCVPAHSSRALAPRLLGQQHHWRANVLGWLGLTSQEWAQLHSTVLSLTWSLLCF